MTSHDAGSEPTLTVPLDSSAPQRPADGGPPPVTGGAQLPDGAAQGPSSQAGKVRLGDRIFRGASVGAGASVLAIMAAIATFLIVQAIPALRADGANFFTYTGWNPSPTGDDPTPMFGIAALAFHTILTALIAMLLAVPIAIGVALFVTYYAPRQIARPIGYLVDLLAAVPSIVYGLWGLFFLAPHLTGLVLWLDRYLGWTFVLQYRPNNIPSNKSDLTAGIVLAIMILPIVSAIGREVFRQVPTANVEAALALGATKWEMIRTAVLPFGRPGLVSASILGLGRALGETLAVTIILTAAYDLNPHITENGGITFASNIALKYNEATSVGIGALISSGLVLFVITLIVNSSAQFIIRRKTVS